MKVRENCIVTEALESIVFFWFGFACYLEYQPTKVYRHLLTHDFRSSLHLSIFYFSFHLIENHCYFCLVVEKVRETEKENGTLHTGQYCLNY